jgi:hypothetical protein
LEGIGTWGRSGDLLRPGDDAGSFFASYPCSTSLFAPLDAPPSYTNVFDPSFALAPLALPPTNTSTSAWPGVPYPAQFRPPDLPAATVQLPVVPVQSLSPDLYSTIDTSFNFQQAALNPTLDDWNADFNFESLAAPNDDTSGWDQLTRDGELQHHSPIWDPFSPTSGTGSSTNSTGPTTSSLALSGYGSSPTPINKTNPKPGMTDSFSCSKCAKECGSRAKLQRHVKNHDERKYSCSRTGCNRRFTTEADRKRHENKIAHGGRKAWWCAKCGRAFGRKDNLRKHEKKVHSVNFHKVGLLEGRG